jgi:fucose permease
VALLSPPHMPDLDRRALRRARAAVFVLFGVSGAAIGTWTARIPAIRHNLNLSDAQLSIALVALALGGLVAMRCTGRLVDRYSSTTVLKPAALLLGPVLVIPACAPNLGTLIMALICLGAVHGTLNVAQNANAAECQRAYRRPIMTSFHGLFSIGGFSGAATGGLFARADLSPTTTFVTMGAAIAVLAAWATRAVQTAPYSRPPRRGPSTPEDDRRRPAAAIPPSRHQVLVLGAAAFCCLICEGAAADWSSVCMLDSLKSSTATAAAAYAIFSLAMTAGRLTGDRLVAVLGPIRLLRACGIVSSAGFTAGILSGNPSLAIVGFGALGAGLSCIVPQIYSTAANLDVAQSGQGLSQVASLGYLGFVSGPVIVGSLATWISLAHAMLLLPLLTLIVAATAGNVRTPVRLHAAS